MRCLVLTGKMPVLRCDTDGARAEMNDKPIRREFLKQAAVAAALPAALSAAQDEPIPKRAFGKTGVKLPILAYGGAALPKKWANPLSTPDRVKLVRYAFDQGIRYFDTAGNYSESQSLLGAGLKGVRDDAFLVTKVETTDPSKVRAAVEKSLKELQTDHLDALLIHGTPGIEQMSVRRAMQVHTEIVKLRDEGITKHIGFSAHSYFDKALALIETGGFELCMLSYGHIPRGHNQTFSPRMIRLREECLTKAHECGMGVAAMKVIGAGTLGAWSGRIVPDFDKRRLPRLPGAAIRFVLDDERIDLLVIGMRLRREIDANIRTLAGDTTYTAEDRALLKAYSVRALATPKYKAMRVD